MSATEKRGRDGTLWDDPDHPDGLPWHKNRGFLHALREERGDAWVGHSIVAAQDEHDLPEVRRLYRMWLSGCRGALTTLANGPNFPSDEYLQAVLERPGMYAGPSVQTLELILLNLLSFRAIVFGRDYDSREILRKTYAARFGHSAGAAGPAPKLVEQYGDDPAHPEIRAFYKAFVEVVLD